MLVKKCTVRINLKTPKSHFVRIFVSSPLKLIIFDYGVEDKLAISKVQPFHKLKLKLFGRKTRIFFIRFSPDRSPKTDNETKKVTQYQVLIRYHTI